MGRLDHTVRFKAENDKSKHIEEIITKVYNALDSKGYNPVNQIIGYLLSGDPAFITSHQDARILIQQVERDEIMEALLKNYLVTKVIK